MIRTVFLICASLFWTSVAMAQGYPYVWAQLVGQDLVSVRAITDQDCSAITASVPLSVRGPDTLEPMGGITVCEGLIDMSTTPGAVVTIAGKSITLPRSAPKRVVLLGDTGCRKDGSRHDQKCVGNDWPFHTLAKAMAKTAPDLIVHVGDYVYRYNCGWGGNREGCHGGHQLKEWKYWKSDFFDPAQVMLPIAPWVFVRGNHEDCEKADRGWRGWTLLLSMHPQQSGQYDPVADSIADCLSSKYNVTKPVLMTLSGGTAPPLSLYAYDTANEKRLNFRDFDPLVGVPNEAWIVTHVPFQSRNGTTITFAPAGTPGYRGGLPNPVSMVMSGHVHLFQIVQAAADQAVQLVVGGSGTKLDRPHMTSETINSEDYTYMVIDRETNGVSKMTVCAINRHGALSAWRSWQVTLSAAGSAPMLSKINKITSACHQP